MSDSHDRAGDRDRVNGSSSVPPFSASSPSVGDYDVRAGDAGGRSDSRERDSRRSDVDSRDPLPPMPPRVSHRQSIRKVYVGNLPTLATEKDVMDLFANSPVPCALPAQIDLKTGYAFVHFDETRGLDEAIPRLAGTELLGQKVRVETSKATTSSRCFTCGMEGHWSRDCPHSSRPRGSNGSYPSSSRSGGAPREPPYPRRSRSPDPYARRRSPPARYDYGRPPRSPPRYDRALSPGRDRYYEGRDDRGPRGYDRGYGGGGSGGYYGGGGAPYGGGYGGGSAYPPPPAGGYGGSGGGYPPPPPGGYGGGPPSSRGYY